MALAAWSGCGCGCGGRGGGACDLLRVALCVTGELGPTTTQRKVGQHLAPAQLGAEPEEQKGSEEARRALVHLQSWLGFTAMPSWWR